MMVLYPKTPCKRDTCENETELGKEYCSSECWKADNPEKWF